MTTGVARLVVLIMANALLRIAGGASGILVGLYLSDAASRGMAVDAGLASKAIVTGKSYVRLHPVLYAGVVQIGQ